MVCLKIKASQNLTEQKVEIDGVDITDGVVAIAVDASTTKQPQVILTIMPENVDLELDAAIDKINHVRLRQLQNLEVAEDLS